MNENAPKTELEKIWKKLEKLCIDLWGDNSPRAVPAQALMEEYRSEMARFDALTAQTAVNIAQAERASEETQATMRAHYVAEMDALKKRIGLLERLVKDKTAENQGLLSSIAEHEKRNTDFHAQVLKMAAANDEAASKQMEELYRELKQKEEGLSSSWSKREAVLVEDDRVLRGILATRQSELDAWEKRRIVEEDAIKRSGVDLEIKAKQLQQEYRLKQQEIETLKASLQRSVTELVRQYQSRLKDEAPTHAER
jgi:hypothetical protein